MLAENNVQSTIGKGGSRVWVYPHDVTGSFTRQRRWVAWALLLFYLLLPWIHMGGHPLVQVDVFEKRLVLLGQSFWAQDVRLFLPLVIAGILSVFLVTMMWGRVWCGWACPQTVFLQFLFAPIEKFIEGPALKRKSRDKHAPSFDWLWRKAVKFAVFFFIAFWIGNTFLAYFTGREWVLQAMTQSPWLHPEPFLFVLGFAVVFFLIFAWFKEQACIIVCPYARFQSVLTDEDSKVITYDMNRGEPRGRPRKREKQEGLGDCVSCNYCVKVCPTGIDIREGSQLECIACARCIDACDKIMDAWKRPRGLIRYATLHEVQGENQRNLRPRVFVYSGLIAALLVVFSVLMATRSSVSAELTRKGSQPYFLLADSVSNIFALKIRNKSMDTHRFAIRMQGIGTHNFADTTVDLQPGELKTLTINMMLPRQAFHGGEHPAELQVYAAEDPQDVRTIVRTRLLGPYGG